MSLKAIRDSIFRACKKFVLIQSSQNLDPHVQKRYGLQIQYLISSVKSKTYTGNRRIFGLQRQKYINIQSLKCNHFGLFPIHMHHLFLMQIMHFNQAIFFSYQKSIITVNRYTGLRTKLNESHVPYQEAKLLHFSMPSIFHIQVCIIYNQCSISIFRRQCTLILFHYLMYYQELR